MLRGAGGSEGDFSASGWLEDLGFLVDQQVGADGRIWLVGFGLGGALALRLAAGDQRVAGVASLAAPADLAAWVADPTAVLERCRRSGVIHTGGFPADEAAWAAELVALRPLEAAAQLGGRPLLVVHGTEDDEVPHGRGPGAGRRGGGQRSGGSADRARGRPLAAGRPPGGGHPDRLGRAPALSAGSRAVSRPSSGSSAAAVQGPVDGPAQRPGGGFGVASAPVSQRTTTKWRTPAAARPGTVSGVTPPVTNTGTSGRRWPGRRSPSRCPAARLGRRGHDRAGREVVDRLGGGAGQVGGRVGGQPDDGLGAEDPAGQRRRCVVLADVDAVGPDLQGQVGPVVQDERHAEVGADPSERPGPGPAAGRASRSLSRSWTTSTPPRMQAATKRFEVGPVGGAEVEPAVGSRPLTGRGRPLRCGSAALGLRLGGRLGAGLGGAAPSPLRPSRPPSSPACTGAPRPGCRRRRCRPPTGRCPARRRGPTPPPSRAPDAELLAEEGDEDPGLLVAEPGQRLHPVQQFLARRPRPSRPVRRRRRIPRRRCGTGPGPGRPSSPGTGAGQACGRTARPAPRGPWRRWPRRPGGCPSRSTSSAGPRKAHSSGICWSRTIPIRRASGSLLSRASALGSPER